jgi:hypothetical protein
VTSPDQLWALFEARGGYLTAQEARAQDVHGEHLARASCTTATRSGRSAACTA